MEKEGKKLSNPNGNIYGYARVSTKGQNLDRQLIDLIDYGVEENMIFCDKESGKNYNRPAYKKLMHCIRKGDLIVVKSVDRLGRDYQDNLDQWKMIVNDIGCNIHVIDFPQLNTTTRTGDLTDKLMGEIFLMFMSYVAEMERENTLKRQREGIKAALTKREVKVKKPKKKMPYDFWEIYMMWREGEYKSNDLWRYCNQMYGMSQRTFYRRINELQQRFKSFSVKQLRKMIVHESWYDGIEFSNERIEAAMGYNNQYVQHDPEKEKRQRAKRNKKIEMGMTEDEEELSERLRREMLAERRNAFHELYGIRDENGVYVGMDEYEVKGTKKKKGKNQKILSNHADNSGIEDAQDLINDPTRIPDIGPGGSTDNEELRGKLKTNKTIIII